jgi:hypothetical protein
MAPLEKAYFSGQDSLCDADVTKAEVSNFTSGPKDALRRFGWQGKAACCVGLRLTGDNRRIDSGQFLTVGTPETGKIKLDARKVWLKAASNASITISLSDLDEFCFPHGTLCSNFLDGNRVAHSICLEEEGQNPTAILDDERGDYGIGEFCLRLVCTIRKSSAAKGPVNIKYSILIFPNSKEELLAVSFNTESAAWPGILLTDGVMPLLPEPSKKWQCPIVPVIISGTPFNQHGYLPPEGALRRAIATIMDHGVLPEPCSSATTLAKMWEKLAKDPNEFCQKTGSVSWPKPTPETPDQGEYTKISCFFLLTYPPVAAYLRCLL